MMTNRESMPMRHTGLPLDSRHPGISISRIIAIVLVVLGFANSSAQLNWFRYYSDVNGTMDLFSVTRTTPGVSGLDISHWQMY